MIIVLRHVDLRIHELWVDQQPYSCALIGPKTRFVFRSKSANFHILIQLSAGLIDQMQVCFLRLNFLELFSEMWDYTSNGDLFFEMCLDFLRDLHAKWAEASSEHQVTVVFFSRTQHPDTGKIFRLNLSIIMQYSLIILFTCALIHIIRVIHSVLCVQASTRITIALLNCTARIQTVKHCSQL